MRRYRNGCTVGLVLLTLIAATDQAVSQDPIVEAMDRFRERNKPYYEKIQTAELNYQKSLRESAERQLECTDAWRQYLALPARLNKAVIHVERGINCFHTIALLTNPKKSPLTIEVDDEYVCQQLVSQLKEFPRSLFEAPVANKLGSVRLYYDDPSGSGNEETLEIGISDCGFIMGDGPAGLTDTSFYSWTLANLLARTLKVHNANLTQLSFNILSGANAIGSPVKFNSKIISARAQEYWSQPADTWYSFPKNVRRTASVQGNELVSELSSYKVTVLASVDRIGEFEWYGIPKVNPSDLTATQILSSLQRERIDERYVSPLLQTRVTFASPIDVSECTILGIISLVGRYNSYNTKSKGMDVFVTDKGFLSLTNDEYRLFHSYDLAVWLEAYMNESNQSLSQKAFNVLSCADLIVSRRAEYLGINLREYNSSPASLWYEVPANLVKSRRLR